MADCKGILPSEERPRECDQKPIDELAEQGEDEDDGDDLRRLSDLLAIDEETRMARRTKKMC